MKRLLVSLFVGSLVATAVGVVPASAADVFRVWMYGSGANAFIGEVRGDVWIGTEVEIAQLATSQEASRSNAEMSPFLHVSQGAYKYDAATGDIGDFLWSAATVPDSQLTTLHLAIARDLSSASVSLSDASIVRCDATFTCTPSTESIAATFTAIGPTLHFHQNEMSSTSRQSRFVYKSSGPYRFAHATVTIGTDSFGPSTDPGAADIYDTRTGYMSATLVPFGMTAPAAATGVTVYNTTGPEIGHQTGSAVQASWSSTQDGITVETFVTGSSRSVNSNGTFSDEKLAFYNEQVYAIDEAGNFTPLSSTYSLDSRTPDSVVVDNVLRTGSMQAAALPVETCTWTGGDVLCFESTVSIDLSFVGVGDITRATDGNNAGVAGFWTETSHGTSTTRQATASGKIDGQDLGPVQSAQLDQFRWGYRLVEIKPLP